MKVRIQERHSNFSLEESVAEIIPTKYEIQKKEGNGREQHYVGLFGQS